MIVFLCGEAVALMGTPKSEWGSKRHIAGPDLRWRNMMSRSLSVLMVGRMLIRNMEERRLENVSGDFGRCGEFCFRVWFHSCLRHQEDGVATRCHGHRSFVRPKHC